MSANPTTTLVKEICTALWAAVANNNPKTTTEVRFHTERGRFKQTARAIDARKSPQESPGCTDQSKKSLTRVRNVAEIKIRRTVWGLDGIGGGEIAGGLRSFTGSRITLRRQNGNSCNNEPFEIRLSPIDFDEFALRNS